jgi:predicted DNA-binding transcriptional regulator AlpA
MLERKLKRWMKRKEVMKASGLERTALKEAIERKEFPAPIRPTPSGRADRWDEDEIIAYQEARTAARVQRQEEIAAAAARAEARRAAAVTNSKRGPRKSK